MSPASRVRQVGGGGAWAGAKVTEELCSVRVAVLVWGGLGHGAPGVDGSEGLGGRGRERFTLTAGPRGPGPAGEQ